MSPIMPDIANHTTAQTEGTLGLGWNEQYRNADYDFLSG